MGVGGRKVATPLRRGFSFVWKYQDFTCPGVAPSSWNLASLLIIKSIKSACCVAEQESMRVFSHGILVRSWNHALRFLSTPRRPASQTIFSSHWQRMANWVPLRVFTRCGLVQTRVANPRARWRLQNRGTEPHGFADNYSLCRSNSFQL